MASGLLFRTMRIQYHSRRVMDVRVAIIGSYDSPSPFAE